MSDTRPAARLVVREPFGPYQRGDMLPDGAMLTPEEEALCTRAAMAFPQDVSPPAGHQDEER